MPKRNNKVNKSRAIREMLQAGVRTATLSELKA